jgi:hypothetical protein
MDSKAISFNDINPIDYYNFNHIQDCFDLLCKINNVRKTGIDSLTYVKNEQDSSKRMIVVEDGFFLPKLKNGLNLEVGVRYSAFMLLQKVVYKNNFSKALNYVKYKKMNHDMDYIRVGVKYYKIIIKKDRYKVDRTELKVWDKTIINDDLGRDFLLDIPKYDDFTIVPNNKEYNRIIGNNYNLYSPFAHQPCTLKKLDKELGFFWTNNLLKHVFGEQYDLGLKYMKLLYDSPKQALPILVLVSEERETGKSTFVDFLTILFGDNSVVINPQDIANGFNSSYATKNVIAIEESRFESVQATEKLKNLSTQKKILVNAKFVQQSSLPFFGHLIITSNDENKFSKVDNPEIRYWVRKVPTLKGKANHNILDDMVSEIPQFLMYLNTLPKIDDTKSRMVFTAAELKTEALEMVKSESLPGLHKDIVLMLEDHCMNNPKVKEFYFTANIVKDKWFRNAKSEVNYINKILRDSLKLEKKSMMRFVPLEDSSISNKKLSGRPYVYENEYYDRLV